ncbi:MAG: 1-acyl-sn-glycerol-3-phosphate acyltransferase [Chloroflexota bacterium]|nr:1-acyl-sn-glycerol-3-phosphate acyltransferase [Chloroflexota bacterium]
MSAPRSEGADSPHPVDLGKGTLRGPAFRVVRSLLLAVVGPVVRLRLEGIDYVPASGPLVVVCNHLHNADPVLLAIAFPRPVHFMAKKEAFGNPVIRAIIRRVGAFPVDRGRADRAAIRRAQATLRQGIPVGIFPEGTRSRTGSMRRAQPGAALLALRTGAPVLPIAIAGSERLPFDGGSRGRGDAVLGVAHPRGVVIRFGRPFVLPREIDGQRLSTKEATERMMRAVAALLPPAYRGEYGVEAGGPTPPPSSAGGDVDGLPSASSPGVG